MAYLQYKGKIMLNKIYIQDCFSFLESLQDSSIDLADIQHSILESTSLFLLDLYIWNRTNTTKKLMFGSYPYPRNFYAQNTSEFITIYVKDGKPTNNIPEELKEQSKLSQKEWVQFTKQIWDIPIPNKSDLAFGKHAAIMPEAIPYRLIKLYSFIGDIVLDPFAGSGTTLKVAKELGRNFIGYEIYPHYKSVIEEKLGERGLFAIQGQDNAQ